MKIIYLSGARIPSKFAYSVHVMKMCNALKNYKHEIVLFAIKGKSTNNIYEYYDVKNYFKIEFTSYPKIPIIGTIIYSLLIKLKVKFKYKYDFIYSRHLYSLFFLSNENIPFIYETHVLPSSKIKKYIEYLLFINKNCKNIIVISESLKNDYIKIYPNLNKNKICVHHDASDIPVYNAINQDIEWPGRSNSPQIGYVGSLYCGRGIELIKKLSESLQFCDFHIVGGNNKDVKNYKDISINKNIFFHGYIEHCKLRKFYDKFDIVLSPYQNRVELINGIDTSKWMSPLKIFEYMSYKKAIISSDLPVIREILTNNKNAILVDCDKHEQWIDAINLLIKNKMMRNKIGQEAYNLFKEKYTWNKRVETILEKIKN